MDSETSGTNTTRWIVGLRQKVPSSRYNILDVWVMTLLDLRRSSRPEALAFGARRKSEEADPVSVHELTGVVPHNSCAAVCVDACLTKAGVQGFFATEMPTSDSAMGCMGTGSIPGMMATTCAAGSFSGEVAGGSDLVLGLGVSGKTLLFFFLVLRGDVEDRNREVLSGPC